MASVCSARQDLREWRAPSARFKHPVSWTRVGQ
jgi:hypothetical protein